MIHWIRSIAQPESWSLDSNSVASVTFSNAFASSSVRETISSIKCRVLRKCLEHIIDNNFKIYYNILFMSTNAEPIILNFALQLIAFFNNSQPKRKNRIKEYCQNLDLDLNDRSMSKTSTLLMRY